MICILAGSELEATRWAEGQALKKEEWFYPSSINNLKNRSNFHVIVVGTFGSNPDAIRYFERLYQEAKFRGKINRS